MSDPIRSISQNNFLLADQKEVSHDNTLSGNGTEESPLGLNETVLFEVTGTQGVSTCTLSESPFNFQYLEIYVSEQSELDAQCNKIYILSGNIQRIHVHYNSGNNQCQFVAAKGTISGNTLSITDSLGYDAGFSSGNMSLTRSNSSQLNCIRKVVGINRIANN